MKKTLTGVKAVKKQYAEESIKLSSTLEKIEHLKKEVHLCESKIVL